MGYNENSLSAIVQSMPERFDTDEGEQLEESLRALESVALERCAEDMREGILSIYRRFLDLHEKIPKAATLRTPSIKRGINFRWLERRNPQAVWMQLRSIEGREILQTLARLFESQIHKILENIDGFYLKRGPIKEEGKIVDEVFWRWPKEDDEKTGAHPFDPRIRFIRDIIRGRIEATSLLQVENILHLLTREIMRGQLFDVSSFNTYDQLFPRRDWALDRPYLAINFAFAVTEDMPYELQVMTERAALVGKITHMGLLLDNPLPPQVQEDAETLAWASHILDYEEYVNESM